MLVGAAYRDQVVPPCTHARAIVASVNRILVIQQPPGFASDIVDASPAHDFFEAWVAEGIEILARITELVKVQDDIGIVFEFGSNGTDEPFFHHCVRIADYADLAPGSNDTRVVHQMLMIVTTVRHLQQQPCIDLILERADGIRNAGVVFDDDDFEEVAVNVLLAEVVQQVKAFANAPVHEDQTDLGPQTGALFNQLHFPDAMLAATWPCLKQATRVHGS